MVPALGRAGGRTSRAGAPRCGRGCPKPKSQSPVLPLTPLPALAVRRASFPGFCRLPSDSATLPFHTPLPLSPPPSSAPLHSPRAVSFPRFSPLPPKRRFESGALPLPLLPPRPRMRRCRRGEAAGPGPRPGQGRAVPEGRGAAMGSGHRHPPPPRGHPGEGERGRHLCSGRPACPEPLWGRERSPGLCPLSAAGPCVPLRVLPKVRVTRGSLAQFCFTCGILLRFTFSSCRQVQRNSSFSTPGGCEARCVALLEAWEPEGKVSRSSEDKRRCPNAEFTSSLRRPHVGIRDHWEQKLHLRFFRAFGAINKYRFVCCL